MQILWKWSWLLLLSMAACNPATQKKKSGTTTVDSITAINKDSTIGTTHLQIEPFVPPAAIEGCTGLYAADSAGLRQQQYLFAASYSGTAFVKLNGQLQQLTLQQRSNNDTEIKEIYTGNNITVTITATQQQRSGDEVWLYHGTLLVESAGTKTSQVVWGEMGC